MKNLISLGEGNTPLIRLNNIEKLLLWKGEILAKAEYQNPTGSFKDRGSVTEVAEALKKGKRGIVCASTGNMAASLASYSTKAKVKCLVVCPNITPENKLKQAILCGARLIKIKGSYDLCVEKAKKISVKEDLLLCGDYELRRFGQRSLGRELAESNIKFDAFIVPVGNGTLGCSIIEGFIEKGKCPKFIGVQGKGADPLAQAWKKNYSTFQPIRQPKTIASAMKVGNPLDGKLTLAWVRKTNGLLLSVDNKEILKAQKLLAEKEGIFVETSAAATLAGLVKKLQSNIKLEQTKKLTVVLILTGSGLKESI